MSKQILNLKNSNNFILITILIFLSGCATTQSDKSAVKLNQGNWEARALIRDIKSNKSYILNLDIYAMRPDKLRLDATTTIGMHMASVAMSGSVVEYFVVSQKKFYKSKPGPNVFKPVLAIPIDPKAILSLLLEDNITLKDWICKFDGNGLLQTCENKIQSLALEVIKRSNDKRTFLIKHPQAELQLALTKFKTKIENPEALFTLEMPKGFTLVN